MDKSMRLIKHGEFVYYICERIPVRHAFTTKFGGVSKNHCESLNLGFGRGDDEANVRENYRRLAEELQMDVRRFTLTRQIHDTQISVVTEEDAGTGLFKPLKWDSDALITSEKNTPLCGFSADCVVTLFYDPSTETAGVAHAGWRGMAASMLPKTVDAMADKLGASRDTLIAVMGPSIHQECFETDADVPEAMEKQIGASVRPFVMEKGMKFHVDLQGIGGMLLKNAGLKEENVIDSGICTMCESDILWSHRKTKGVRGVQAGVICV